MSNKVVIIGLDGAAFRTLGPWMEAGHLPALKELIETGVSGPLTSVIPPVTAPAWVSFMTGKNPGKHGIYYFTTKEKNTGREIPVSANAIDGKTVWELLSESGKTVLVLNVPGTYPPRPVNGVLVADFLTPRDKRDFTHPASLLDEIEAKFGPYPLYLKTPVFSANLSEANVESFLAELYEELNYKFAVTHYLMDRYDPDFTMLHLWGTDRIQHELWNLFDAKHPRYDRKLGSKYQSQIISYFSAVDAELAKLRKRLDEDTTLIIMSDHGFGPIHRFIDLNAWLLQEGYIAIKQTPLSQLRLRTWQMGLTNEVFLKGLLKILKLGFRLPDRTPADAVNLIREDGFQPLLSLNDADWSKTKAYAKFGLGQIVINVAGRDPKGSVSPGEEYYAVREEIMRKLKDLRDPDTGQLIGGEVYLKEEVYQGPYLEDAPDITYLPLENNYMANVLMGFTTRKWIMNIPALFGNHRMDGIFIAHGKHLGRGQKTDGAQIIDVVPTVLYLMGEKIPTDMDGKVLTDLFTEEFLKSHTVEWTEPGQQEAEQMPVLSQEDEETIIERLKGLGYL
ncbi:MAG: alkaline phosphatase family protein [Acidobacteria bacterium]|nr:alkaline phosphatase family protein [Acidobacteriota bacterium]